MNNKNLGNTFEREFSLLLSSNGFWCHRLQDNKNGQPADIIAVKGNQAALIDCKLCINNTFSLSRMEENQINAMRKWLQSGNVYACFAIKITDDIRMLNFEMLIKLKNDGIKKLDENDITKYSIPFEAWKEQF